MEGKFPRVIVKEKSDNLNRKTLRPIPLRRNVRWISWAEAAVRSLKYLSFLARNREKEHAKSVWYGAVRRETERLERAQRDHQQEWKKRIDVSARRLNSIQESITAPNVLWAMRAFTQTRNIQREGASRAIERGIYPKWVEAAKRSVEHLQHGEFRDGQSDQWTMNAQWNLKIRLKRMDSWDKLLADLAHRANKRFKSDTSIPDKR